MEELDKLQEDLPSEEDRDIDVTSGTWAAAWTTTKHPCDASLPPSLPPSLPLARALSQSFSATCNLVRALSMGTCKQIDRNSIACMHGTSFLLAPCVAQTLLVGLDDSHTVCKGHGETSI
jgi:hypothetical protein